MIKNREVHLGQVVDIKAVDPAFDYRFQDGVQLKFANLARHKTQEEISRVLGPEVAAQWNALMKRAERMWDVSREPFVESELTSILSLIKSPTVLRDLKVIAPWKSLRELADELLPDTHLRYILDRYATYSGSDPRLAPAVLSTIAFVEEAFGAWHITGGIGKLSEAVYQRCIDLGVTFEFSSPVETINHTKSRVTAFCVTGREYKVTVPNAFKGFRMTIRPCKGRGAMHASGFIVVS